MKRELKSLGIGISKYNLRDRSHRISGVNCTLDTSGRMLRSRLRNRNQKSGSKKRSRSPSPSEKPWPKISTPGMKNRNRTNPTGSSRGGKLVNKPIGIINLGNTCYLNSVIQTVVHVPGIFEIFNKLSNVNVSKKSLTETESLGHKIVMLISILRDTAEKRLRKQQSTWLNEGKDNIAVRPVTLANAIRHRHPSCGISGSGQQDAQEMLVLCFQAVEEFCTLAKRVTKTISSRMSLQKIISGESTYEMKCLSCLEGFKRSEKWQCLQVPIENNRLLRDSIIHACRDEEFKGADQYHCSKCGYRTDAVQSHRFRILPDCLFLHLIVYEIRNGMACKKRGPFDVPKDLDLPYSANSNRSVSYSLNATISHAGDSIFSGHYVSYVRKDPKLYLCNDAEVSEVPVLTLSGTRENRFQSRAIGTPYILAYSRRTA